MNTNQQTVHQMGFGINEMVKQATGRESVSSIDMDWVSVEQLARYIYGSGTGDVVSFDTNIPDAIESLIAYITAVQDLNGYDNPWPAGGGKNLLPPLESESKNSVAISVADDGTITINGTASEDTYFDCDFSLSWLQGVPFYFMAFNPVASSSNRLSLFCITTTGNPQINLDTVNAKAITQSSSADSTATRWRLRVPSGVQYTNFVIKPMLQIDGTEPSAYSPYSNICPITGWTGCTVTNENMLDSSDPDYHADTYAFTFPDGAGTVYGGALDVLTGVLTVDMACVDLGTLSWNATGALSNEYSANVPNIKPNKNSSSLANVICSAYPQVTYANRKDKSFVVIWANSSAAGKVYFIDSNYNTSQTFKTAMSGVQLVYELATPVTYQLTAQEVTALIGQNIISANTGNVSVEYKVKEDLV